jgi:hypothetical protein
VELSAAVSHLGQMIPTASLTERGTLPRLVQRPCASHEAVLFLRERDDQKSTSQQLIRNERIFGQHKEFVNNVDKLRKMREGS